ncbi:hypothetical protein R3P38DRAFT_3231081 [Favolaschia claudopus]|uniref:Uncharacterized protein n=1 Tax=Favolaschia claudopus TaxID=2862362 RepID=A0AAV9ZLE4_9AGAR
MGLKLADTTQRRSLRNASASTTSSVRGRGKSKAKPKGKHGGAARAGPGRDSAVVELAHDDPLAPFWAPFANSDTWSLIQFFEDPNNAQPDEEVMQAVERLRPVILEYRQRFDSIPEEVKVLLVTSSYERIPLPWPNTGSINVFKGIAKNVPGQTALIPAYRALRPPQDVIDKLGPDPVEVHQDL